MFDTENYKSSQDIPDVSVGFARGLVVEMFQILDSKAEYTCIEKYTSEIEKLQRESGKSCLPPSPNFGFQVKVLTRNEVSKTKKRKIASLAERKAKEDESLSDPLAMSLHLNHLESE